jgi:geranylgeranyl reductase family protein
MNHYNVAIAGGGPVGNYVATQIAKEGYTVAVFEEHKTIGEPLSCAGLVTSRVFDITSIPQNNIVQNELFGAHIFSPDGTRLSFSSNNVHALAIERSRFDQELSDHAQQVGAQLFTNSKIISAIKKKEKIFFKVNNGKTIHPYTTSLLIGADGPRSTVRRSFKFPEPSEFLIGTGAEVTNIDIDPNHVQIYVGNHIAPGFFAWIIPTNKKGTEARIGLCIGKETRYTPQECFSKLLDQKALQGIEIKKRIGGIIPLGPLKQTVDTGIMLVGDAAAQVKPTSGGGLYPGLLSAYHCSSTAIKALKKERVTRKMLQEYHTLWTKEIGKELAVGMKLRRLFQKFTDEQFTHYLKKLNTPKNIAIICKYGDIDYPSKLLLPLLKTSPSLISLLPGLLKIKKQ